MVTDEPIITLERVEDPGFRDFNPNGVIDTPFWERYNTRLEFPISIAFGMLLLTLGLCILVGLPEWKRDKAMPNINTLGGEDEAGEGSISGGGADLAMGTPPTADQIRELSKDLAIGEVNKDIKEFFKLEEGEVEVSESDKVAYAQVDAEIRKKLLGAKFGSGNGTTGGDANGGRGPGGTGASSTYARALRWIMRFETSEGGNHGREYLEQIGGIGGAIMVPVPPDNRQLILFKDPRNLATRKVATDADIQHYASLIQFAEVRRDSVQSVATALSLNFQPQNFFAYFPRDLEEKLAALEKNYKNKTAEQIRSTTFKVIRRGGAYDFVVVDQQLR